MKKIITLCLLIAAAMMLMLPSIASAHYVLSCAFTGNVSVDGRPVPDGTEIIPWVPGVAPEIYEGWKTETRTTVDGVSFYFCQVPADNPSTPEKDGAYYTDDVRFYIRLGVIDLLANGSGNYWDGVMNFRGLKPVDLTASYMSPPQLISPEDGVKIQAVEVTLDWSDVVAPGVTYSLQISTSSTFTSTAVDVSGLSDSDYTVSFVSGPLAAGTYYWRVEAVDGGVWNGGWSEVWSFGAPDIGDQSLVSGWNLITYKGDTLPTDIALASLGDHLVVIWGRDNGTGEWCGYAPGGGFANDLVQLEQYEPYWMYVNQAIVLHYIIDC
jgi:hypothetical protein